MDELVAPVLHPLDRSAKRRGWALPLGAVGAEQDSSILGFTNRSKSVEHLRSSPTEGS
jgi:hypothetical protein